MSDAAGGTPTSRNVGSKIAKTLRIPLGFLLAGLYLWFAPEYTNPLKLAVGAAVAIVGLVVRGWAAGHIVKNDRLATTGPYAHTRNPLYFGSFLLAAGFAIAVDWALLLLVIAFWVLVYAPTIQRERRNIIRRFPDAYPEWERNVPAFFPRPTPWKAPEADHAPFSFDLYMRHREWRAALVFVLAIAWLAWNMGERGIR